MCIAGKVCICQGSFAWLLGPAREGPETGPFFWQSLLMFACFHLGPESKDHKLSWRWGCRRTSTLLDSLKQRVRSIHTSYVCARYLQSVCQQHPRNHVLECPGLHLDLAALRTNTHRPMKSRRVHAARALGSRAARELGRLVSILLSGKRWPMICCFWSVFDSFPKKGDLNINTKIQWSLLWGPPKW